MMIEVIEYAQCFFNVEMEIPEQFMSQRDSLC